MSEQRPGNRPENSENETWSAGYRAGWEARGPAGPPAHEGSWHGRGWHRGWFPLPFFPLVLALVVIALATDTWWVLLGIPILWLTTAPLRRRRWARGGWAC